MMSKSEFGETLSGLPAEQLIAELEYTESGQDRAFDPRDEKALIDDYRRNGQLLIDAGIAPKERRDILTKMIEADNKQIKG